MKFSESYQKRVALNSKRQRCSLYRGGRVGRLLWVLNLDVKNSVGLV